MLKLLLKLVKYMCCGIIGFLALACFIGSIKDASKTPSFLFIPFFLLVSGYLTYASAKSKHLEGTSFTWWLYGTFVPIISWMDVHKAQSPVTHASGTPQYMTQPKTVKSPVNSELQIKWETWEMEHDKPEQRKRWMKAGKDCALTKLLDEHRGIALIRGNRGGEYTTSLEMCSCPDFAKRHKPCKHMYFLAHHLGVFDPFKLQG